VASASGALCTGLRGAGDGGVAGAGGAVTAGIDALAAAGGAAGLGEGVFGPVGGGCVVVTAGGGGGVVPAPNRPGEAVGDEGSAIGAASASCRTLVRSAISESVNAFN
jgi:hypothetical protein